MQSVDSSRLANRKRIETALRALHFQVESLAIDDLHKLWQIEDALGKLDNEIEIGTQLGQVLRKVNREINSGTLYQKILDSVFEMLSRVVPFDRLGIGLLEKGGDQLELVWVKSSLGVTSLKKGYSAPLQGSSLEPILKSGQPRILNDLEDYLIKNPKSKSTRLILKDDIRSSFTCPLIAKGKPIGALFFSSRTKNVYTSIHVDAFLEISEEISVLVENGQLREFFNNNEAEEQFLKTLVHDLRNPSAVIKGFLELAREGSWYDQLPKDGKEIMKRIESGCDSLVALVDELAQIKLSVSAQKSLKQKNIEIKKFFENLVDNFRVVAKKKNIEIYLEVKSMVHNIAFLDPAGISRAVENLLTNAVKFSHRDTKISVSVWENENKLFVSVKDQGQGIPEKELPTLFKEFGKTSVRPTADEPSTGLGLAIVKKIINAHNGEVSVTSKPGLGSTFSFYIPLVETTLH